MGKIKYSLIVVIGCVFGLISAFNSVSTVFGSHQRVEISAKTSAKMPPSATITGDAGTVCQNESPPPQITFTGNGGNTPYTFTYRINGGAVQTITTTGTNNAITINADISNVGTFNYTLVSVEDDTGVEPASGNIQIVVIPSPDTTMGGTGSGTIFNGLSVFRQCVNVSSDFTFTNLTTTTGLNTNYTISWGDGSPDFTGTTWSSLMHSYNVGIYYLDYTITGSNGCDSVETYIVFVGSNPAVSLGNPGNTDICNVNPLTFPITGTDNNPPGTIYTVTFNDGSPPQTFNHPPPPSITHSFATSSCNTTSSDGTNSYQNSFSAIIVASNPCSTSSVGVVPIYVSVDPDADFTIPDVACTNQQICLENMSIGDENNGLGSSCDTTPNIIWEVSPATGYTVSSGILGNDFGSSDPNVWQSGSDDLCLTFTQIGTYTITLRTGNRCGMDEIVKTICVEDDLVPMFTTNVSEGCTSLPVTTVNSTDETTSCIPPTYLWEVNYTPQLCGATESWVFTNGTDETSKNPSFQFDAAGTYEITMTATNSCGDFTTSQTIDVKQPPTATIDSVADACGALSFNPIATVETCAPVTDTITYSWLFPGGSPATSNLLDPGTIDYTTVGNYTITFSVTNSCGTTTVTEDFSINDSPTLTNTDFTQTICSGATSTAINLTSDNASTTFSWSSNAPVGLTGYIPNGTAAIIPAQAIVNTTASAITLIYTVTPEISGCLGTPLDFEIIVEPAPLIVTQPQPDAVCLNGTANDLSVAFQGTGTANYQWFENTVDNTTTGTAIAGATSATFTPPTDTVGTLYYYVVITFSTGGCNEITSDTAAIEVANTSQIDTEPQGTQSLCLGGTADELSIVVSGGSGTAMYQWFSNATNTNTGGALIAGATASTYTPPVFTSVGTFYYYVEVSYTISGCSGLTSAVSEVVVVDDPVITTQPLSYQSLCQNTASQDLEVIASGGLGTVSYQWYSNTANNTTSGTVIAGATSSIYTPPTTSVGTLYYYCIVIQDVSGCEVTSTTGEVEISSGAQFDAQPISDELCLGETTSALSISYTNGSGAPTYQWYQNGVNDTTTGTAIAGATSATYDPPVNSIGTLYYYVVIMFNSGGCSEIVSNAAEIIVNETPIIDDSDALICSGNTFEFIPDTTNSGDIVPLNTLYTWTTPVINPAGSVTGASAQLTPIATVSQLLENSTTNPATVTYTVTPSSGDCEGETFDIIVTVNPSISITPVVTNNSCFESDNASIEIAIVGGVPFISGNPYNISWTGPNGFTSSDEDIFNLDIGIYTLEIEDDGGCPYSETFEITEPELLVFSFIDFDPETISCFAEDDGDISIDVAGGTTPYTYAWTLNGAPFSSDEDLTNLGPGEYAISVTDANNCLLTGLIFVIQEPPLLDVTLDTKTDILCFGDATGAISVNVTGGRLDYTFAWTGPNGFTSTVQNIDTLLAGIYNLTVTDSSDCVDTLEVEILQNDEIEIDVTTTEIVCYGDNDASITINTISGGVPPYEVEWSNFFMGNSQINLSAGTYTITITDAENCERDFPIIIDEAPIFLIDPVVEQTSCAGENDASITLNFVGGIDPVTLVWDDDPNAGTERNNLPPGTYSVTITDGTPCVIEDSFTIFNILPLELSANTTDALDCDDANSGSINLLIQGGTPPFDVVWSNGSTTEDLDNIPPNTYVANVTDANGCEIQGSWDINRFEPLVLDVETQLDVDCEAGTIGQAFIAMASGGVPPFQYNWSSGTVSGLNNEMMTTNEDGLVILEVTDGQGCTANYSLNVETPALGSPDFTTSSFGFLNYGVYAIQDPIEFINEATGNYESILWDFGDGSFSAEENPTHTYVEVGSYIVTQTVTYPFGCVFTKVVTLYIEEGYKLVMPDAFTPNEDGLNDYFAPVHIGLNTLEISVYDTWGSLIYKEKGDTIRGWDGKVKEEVAENGNYFYTFSAKTFYGDEIKKQGAFVYIK